jgi:hypothetical protein
MRHPPLSEAQDLQWAFKSRSGQPVRYENQRMERKPTERLDPKIDHDAAASEQNLISVGFRSIRSFQFSTVMACPSGFFAPDAVTSIPLQAADLIEIHVSA